MTKVSDFTLHMISGLKYMHDLKMVHFDIKPPNILVASGVAKLGDFGLTASLFPRRHFKVIGGTQVYLPWDVLNNVVYSGFRNDIWGCGCSVSFDCI